MNSLDQFPGKGGVAIVVDHELVKRIVLRHFNPRHCLVCPRGRGVRLLLLLLMRRFIQPRVKDFEREGLGRLMVPSLGVQGMFSRNGLNLIDLNVHFATTGRRRELTTEGTRINQLSEMPIRLLRCLVCLFLLPILILFRPSWLIFQGKVDLSIVNDRWRRELPLRLNFFQVEVKRR